MKRTMYVPGYLSYFKTKSFSFSYAMRHMPGGGRHNAFPEYEELKRDAPGAGLRKFFLAIYIIVGSLVTAALLALVVLAPTRQYLVDKSILPKVPWY